MEGIDIIICLTKKQRMEGIDIIICLKKKQRLREYQKNYREVKKSQFSD